jgi:hypothetical protein
MTAALTGTSIVTVDTIVSAGSPLCLIAWLFAAPPNPEGPFFLWCLRLMCEPKPAPGAIRSGLPQEHRYKYLEHSTLMNDSF